MKKVYLLFVLAVTAVTLNAQSVWTEYFSDATSGMNLEEYNDWYVCGKEADAMGVSPIIEDESLFYDGYIGSDTGMVVVLDSLMGQTDDTKRISTHVIMINGDTLEPQTSGGAFYAAFIVSILPDSWNSYRDFVTWEGSTSSNWSRGRVFAKVSDDNADVQFAVSKNSSADIAESEVLAGGVEVYHLLVLKYEVVEGESNDIVSLYINPDPTLAEDAQTVVPLVNIDNKSDYEDDTKLKFNVRQRGIGAKIGGIRVGTNWEYVLQGDPTVGIKDNSLAPMYQVYSAGKSIVTDQIGNIEVFDLTGKMVLKGMTTGRMETSLNDGVYVVRFSDFAGNSVTQKVVL